MSGIQELAQYGRGNDSMIAHVTPGEMMVPPEMMARHPQLQRHLYQAYLEEGMDPRQFKVGSGITSINPVTGMPEYGFFKKLFKVAAPVVGYAMGGPMGAAIGGGLAGYSDGGGWKGGVKGAALGYVGGSLAAGGAFGDTVSGWSGGGIGGVGAFGNIGGSAGTWGMDGVSGAITRHGGVGNAWKNLGGKITSSPMAMLGVLGAISDEPKKPTGSSYKPNDDKGEPFDLDHPLEDSDSTTTAPSHAITASTPGYGTGYSDFKAVKQPYLETDYIPSKTIVPPAWVIGNPNVSDEEIMKWYKPVAWKASGGMINQGTTGTADDVPIMASKGEFVMTADAVRNAGNGDPRLGAKKLYNLMYALEGAR